MTRSIRTTRRHNSRHEDGYVCKDKNQTQTACFSTRETANTNLLISWTLSHDACIVRVSDKTLFIHRERISQARDGFQITIWHCRIHRLMCSPSNSPSRPNTEKPMSRQGAEKQIRDKGQNLPALPCKNTPATAGKQNHPAVPVPHTSRRTCLLDNKKNCVPQKRVQSRNCGSSCSLSQIHSKLVSSHVHNVYLIGHFTTLYFTACGSVRTDN